MNLNKIAILHSKKEHSVLFSFSLLIIAVYTQKNRPPIEKNHGQIEFDEMCLSRPALRECEYALLGICLFLWQWVKSRFGDWREKLSRC